MTAAAMTYCYPSHVYNYDMHEPEPPQCRYPTGTSDANWLHQQLQYQQPQHQSRFKLIRSPRFVKQLSEIKQASRQQLQAEFTTANQASNKLYENIMPGGDQFSPHSIPYPSPRLSCNFSHFGG